MKINAALFSYLTDCFLQIFIYNLYIAYRSEQMYMTMSLIMRTMRSVKKD